MTVKYRNVYGTGENSDPWENAPLDKFIMLTPHLGSTIRAYSVLPPIAVLNDFFQKSESNAGMSGSIIWKVFQINKDEYADLVETLCTDPELNIKQDEIFNDITQYNLWIKNAMHEYNPRKKHKS